MANTSTFALNPCTLLALTLVLCLLKLASHMMLSGEVPIDMTNSLSGESVSVKVSDLRDGKMFKFYKGNGRLSYRDGLLLMEESKEFRALVVDSILKPNYVAVFWEFPPISKHANPAPGFEFIVNNAETTLGRASVDQNTFQSYFKEGCSVAVFPNLRGDAQLVAPCPISDSANNAHLASFLRSAPDAQVDELLRTTAQEVKRWLERKDSVVWLSTSGAGVYYLHVRLDSRPKYYTYSPYKNKNYSGD